MKYGYTYDFPIGKLTIVENNQKIVAISFQNNHDYQCLKTKTIQQAKKQLDEYFAGQRQIFDLPLQLTGTPFQNKVYQALLTVPYGQTASYQDIAKMINHPKSYRAVGQANHHNPLVIVVPCHRIIRANQSLGGYGGGLDIKKYLLNLEGLYFK